MNEMREIRMRSIEAVVGLGGHQDIYDVLVEADWVAAFVCRGQRPEIDLQANHYMEASAHQ